MKKVVFWLFIAALVAATAYGLVRKPGQRPLPVFAARAQKTTFVREVSADGYLKAERIRLAFPASGRVAEVKKHPGDRVKRGEVIARLEDAEARRRLALAEARLESFEAEQRAAAADREARAQALREKHKELAEKLALVRALFEAGAASRAELRAAEDALAENARALKALKLEAERARARAASRRAELRAALAEAREALAKTRLRTPVAGVLEALPFHPGELARGEAVLVVEGSVRPYARFPEAEAGELREGLPARVELAGQEEKPLPSRVARVLPPERQGESAWVPVELSPLPAGQGAPDLSLTAYVEVERIEDAVVVPLEALIEEDGKTYVWTIEDGKAHRVAVKKRAQNLTQAAIEGLAPGTPVVRLPPEKLTEGTPLLPTFEDEDGGR